MKKNLTLIILFIACITWSQKTVKINGSRVVTFENREIGNFESVEVSDNIEVFLEKGEQSQLKIEADENLHPIITVDLKDNILKLKTTKKAVHYKKLIVRIIYTNDLKIVVAKNNSVINAIQEIQLEDITFKSYNESKLNLNVNSDTFLLQSDDKSKTELNLKAENATIELNKNSSLKALIASVDLKCDLYQKGKANLEGDVINAKIRLDNNANFIGEKLVIKNCDVIAEGYSNALVNTDTSLNIDASGNSEIKIYGDQKIVLKQFIDSATLIKKPTK
jgi:hypothetical protein